VLSVGSVLSEDGTNVSILVEDNGHGVASEHLTAIFTPFFTTKGEGRGTGLGLSIVKNILDNHNAEIRAETDYSKALSDLQRATSTTFRANNITVDSPTH
jgi:C4-dicarboxylate-specific signal transduction histidine kinase